MARHPDEHEPAKQLSREERDTRKELRQVEADLAISDHEAAQKAFGENRERLKTERLAREAATPAAPAKKPTKAKPEKK